MSVVCASVVHVSAVCVGECCGVSVMFVSMCVCMWCVRLSVMHVNAVYLCECV